MFWSYPYVQSAMGLHIGLFLLYVQIRVLGDKAPQAWSLRNKSMHAYPVAGIFSPLLVRQIEKTVGLPLVNAYCVMNGQPLLTIVHLTAETPQLTTSYRIFVLDLVQVFVLGIRLCIC